jgi:hypothetical protein
MHKPDQEGILKRLSNRDLLEIVAIGEDFISGVMAEAESRMPNETPMTGDKPPVKKRKHRISPKA